MYAYIKTFPVSISSGKFVGSIGEWKKRKQTSKVSEQEEKNKLYKKKKRKICGKSKHRSMKKKRARDWPTPPL